MLQHCMYCANVHRFNYRTDPVLVLEPPLWSIVPNKLSPSLSSCSLDHANTAAYTCTKTSSQVMRTVLCLAPSSHCVFGGLRIHCNFGGLRIHRWKDATSSAVHDSGATPSLTTSRRLLSPPRQVGTSMHP